MDVGPDDQRFVEEDVFRFFRSDLMPLPVLVRIRLVPIEPGTSIERVLTLRHAISISLAYTRRNANPMLHPPSIQIGQIPETRDVPVVPRMSSALQNPEPSGELVGSTAGTGDVRHYLFAPVVAEAILLAMNTACQWDGRYVQPKA